MKMTVYNRNEKLQSGISLKDNGELENNNMALHACESTGHIIHNRWKLANSLSCSLNDFVFANQTHSANFHRATKEDRGRGVNEQETAVPDTDALYTYEPDIVLCSLTADCVPVVFHSDESMLTGVIHSGWQGTVKEITLKLFHHLQQAEQCDLSRVHVQIGAALSQEKFEVDEDVYTKFHDLGYADEFIQYNETTNKYHIDNQLTVKKQCELAGIPAENVTIDRTCTFQSADGFSYREDKKAGRHLSFIQRKA